MVLEQLDANEITHLLISEMKTAAWAKYFHLLPQCAREPTSFCLSKGFRLLGVKEVEDGIWLVSFMNYDLGYIDLEEKTLQPLENPFGPKVLPMS